MMSRRYLWIVVSLLLSLALLSACGGGETNTPEGSDQPTVVADTPTPAPPSPTPTPVATPTPSADDKVNLGLSQKETGQLEKAAATFEEAIRLDPEHADAYFHLGSVYYELDKYEEAITALKKAVELDSTNPDAQRNLGSAYGKLGEWEKAITAYKKAVELKPDFGEAYADLSGAYVSTGEFAEAIAAGEQAVKLVPEYVSAYNNLGAAYCAQGDCEQAIDLFHKALGIDPENLTAHYDLGYAYEEQDDFDRAIAEYREAIRIDPNYLKARQNLGGVLAKQNKWDEAIAEWLALLELDPEYVITHRSLGVAYSKQGKYAEAIAAFETYLTLAPNAPDKTAVEREIARITEAETTYRNAAGGYSFPRPAGWYYEESKALVKFSESATSFKNAPDSAPLIMFQAGPANELAANLDLAADANAVAFIQAMAQSAKLKVDEPETGTIAGYPAALTTIAMESPALRGAMVVILIDGRVVNGLTLSPPNQWEALRLIFVETVKGLVFILPEYRNNTGGYSLSYPGGWSYKEDDEMVSFALTKATIEDSEGAALEEGLLIGFDAATASELADNLGIENSDDPTAFITAMAAAFDAELGNVETGTISGYPAAYGAISGAYEDVSYAGALVAIVVDERLIGGYAMTPPDLWGDTRPLFSDMLDSMTFFEP